LIQHYLPRSPTGCVETLHVPQAPAGRRMLAIGVDDVHSAWRRVMGTASPESLAASRP
jgi:hypothetical protein